MSACPDTYCIINLTLSFFCRCRLIGSPRLSFLLHGVFLAKRIKIGVLAVNLTMALEILPTTELGLPANCCRSGLVGGFIEGVYGWPKHVELDKGYALVVSAVNSTRLSLQVAMIVVFHCRTISLLGGSKWASCRPIQLWIWQYHLLLS